MNKSIDDLFHQADRQLEELDAEYREKELPQASMEEVDSKTAAKFNRVPTRVASHPLRNTILTMLLLLLAADIYMQTTLPRATGPYHLITGTVQDSRISGPGRMHWGNVTTVRVGLPDGQVVSVRSYTGLMPPKGRPLIVRLYDTGAVTPDHPF